MAPTPFGLALLALGIDEGDEVITVPNTFIATAEAITYCKARPVFVDVDPKTFTMNPAELEKSLTERTKAIIRGSPFRATGGHGPDSGICTRQRTFRRRRCRSGAWR